MAESNTNTPESARTRSRRARLIAKWALKSTAMLAVTGAVFANDRYWADVREVDEMMKGAHSYIIENSPVPAGGPQETFDSLDEPVGLQPPLSIRPGTVTRIGSMSFGGFGLTDIANSDKAYHDLDKISSNLSMHYSNRELDTSELANTVTDYIENPKHRINELVLNGNSTGAPIATDVAVKVTAMDKNVGIAVIGMDAPAINEYVLREQSRNDGYAMLAGDKLPGADRSRYARLAAELWLRRADILKNPLSFFGTFNQIHKDIFDNPDFAENTLLIDQFQEIRQADDDMAENLKKLGQLPPERRPRIVFLRAANPADDDVVNTVEAYDTLKKLCDDAGLELSQAIPVGKGQKYKHGFPGSMVSSYHVAMDEYFLPQVEESLEDQREAAQKGAALIEAAPTGTGQSRG